MQVVVVGAGALGALYGGLLVESGARVSLLVRPERVPLLRQTGIVIHAEEDGVVRRRTIRCEIAGSGEELPSADLVILTPKLYDLERACAFVAPCCSEHTAVLTVQNGIDAPTIVSRLLPDTTVLAGETFVIARGNGVPGEVVHSSSDATITFGAWIYSGAREDSHRRAQQVGAFLGAHGVPCLVSESIRTDLWVKFVWFCAYSGVAAGYGLSQGAIAADAQRYELLFAAVNEGLLIAEAEKVTLPSDQCERYRQRMKRTVARTPGTTPTLLRDLESGRRTELDFIAGRMISLGQGHGIKTPALQEIYEAASRRAALFRPS